MNVTASPPEIVLFSLRKQIDPDVSGSTADRVPILEIRIKD